MARSSAKRRTKTERAAPVPVHPPGHGAWDALSSLQQHLVCLGVLLVVAFGFYAPLHLSDRVLVSGDIVNWQAMAESVIEHRQATGEDVLWAPNAFAGMPAYLIDYVRQIPQLDAIPRLLRQVIWPTSHLLFLLLGTYLLVVFLTGNKLAGVLAACAYGLTTYLPIILVAGHNTKFIALCFAPWLALAFLYTLRRPSLLAALLFAIAAAVNLRADHVQITYYVTVLLGLWWLVEGVGAFRHGRQRTFGRATAWLALGSVLALLMVAQPLLVTYEYKQYTIRGAATGGGEGALDWTYAMNWSQGFGELVTLLIPNAYGGASGTYWGPKPFTAGPHYVGGVVLLLAALALWRLRRNAVWALGLGTLVMTGFALGEHFPLLNRLMFHYFPLFDAFRVPETWLSIVALALALLAGFGLYYAGRQESSAEAERQKTRSLYVVAGGTLGLAAVLLLAGSTLFSFERPNEVQQLAQQVAAQRPDLSAGDARVVQFVRQEVAQRAEERQELLRADALRALVFLLFAAAVLFAYRREKLPAWGMQAALALLVVIDLWGVGRRYFNDDALQPARNLETAIATYDFDRFILEQEDAAGGPGHFRVLSLEQGNPTTNARPAYHYQTLGGYHGAKLRLYQDFLDHLLIDPETGLPNENALDLLNTRYVVARGVLPGTEVVYRGEETGLVVAENPDALPRAFFVSETEVVPSREATWARLQSEDFDPRQTALLYEPIDFETTPIDAGSTASAELEAYAPDEIRWTVTTDAPRLLVISEVFYPAGWNAYLDGEPVPIYRADHLLRAVPVPAGSHDLVLRFEPRSHRLSLWISGLSTAFVYGGVLVLFGLSFHRRRTPSVPEAEPETPDA